MSMLYLHIGTPKTATTAIQKFCQDNREVLLKKGYVYPRMIYKYQKANPRRNGHFIVGDEEMITNVEPGEQVEPWKESMDVVMSAFEQANNVILSDESIWHSVAFGKYGGWKRIKGEADSRGFSVKIIVYLRRQDKFAVSWWNQRLKEGYLNSVSAQEWREFVPEKHMELNYYRNLEKMAAVFGRDNILVRIFDRNCFRGEQKNIYSDFLDAIGLELDDNFVINQPETNLGLPGNYHEIRRILNTLPDLDDRSVLFIRDVMLDVVSGSEFSFKYSMLSPEEQKAFLERYRESNRLVARDYLKKTGDLFDDKIDNLPKWTPDNPYMYEDIIRYFGMASLEQQKCIQSLQEQHFQMKQELRTLQSQVNSMYKSAIFKTYRKARKLIKNKE